jgi:hypothetical protein
MGTSDEVLIGSKLLALSLVFSIRASTMRIIGVQMGFKLLRS